MATPPPAVAGMRLDEVDTPALIVDLDAFESNLRRMADEAKAAGVRLRPHAKTHKCAVIALQQMALGAVGVCCQKVGEAEAMVYGGVPDVLVTNQIVGAVKLRRLAALARRARMGVCVDDAGNLDDVAAAAAEAGVVLDLYIEIEVGMGRCGVSPDEAAVALAKRAASKPSLRFMGLLAYQGAAQHLRGPEERERAIAFAAARSREAKALIEAAGIPCPIVTGAGTGTYRNESASRVYNEIEPGSYIFMDADYARNRGAGNRAFDDFRHSLFILATVMSRPKAGVAVVDAGLKAMSVDSGLPVVDGVAAEYIGASDEHGKLRLEDSAEGLKLGTKLRLIPGHCDPTVNLYDWYVGIRGGRVEAVWPIAARGAIT
ncbi:MAG: DSD1 family PLP-dependent enzyme [Alphaproteobacteria bacterium]|nr:DSD1 family PLP-dependent enzyme [Alphaproteobacteria bacterium]